MYILIVTTKVVKSCVMGKARPLGPIPVDENAVWTPREMCINLYVSSLCVSLEVSLEVSIGPRLRSY